MNCPICEEELNEEEIESPYKDKSGRIICDACFKDKYSHICPLCENYFDEDFTKEISPKYILISDYAAGEVGTDSGIYEITSYPFFRDGMIEMSMIDTAINRIGDLPKEFDEDDFTSDIFYVCDECVKKLLATEADQ